MKTKYAILTVLFFILAFAPVVVKADVNKDLSKQFSDLSRQMDDLQRSQQAQGNYYPPTSARNVVGYLDEARADGIYGWAWDPDAGSNPIQINIYVDGKFVKAVTADQERPDIYVDPSRPVGSKHGYSWKNHGLTGTHSIEAFGVDYPKGTEESLGVKTYYGSGVSNAIPPSSYPTTPQFENPPISVFPVLLITIIVVVVIVVVVILVYFFVMKGTSGTSAPAAPSAAPSKVSPPPAKKKMPSAPNK